MEHGASSKKGEKSSEIGGVRREADQYNWKDLNRVLVTQDSTDPSEAKVLWAQALPAGSVRETRVCTQVVGDPAYGRREPGGHDLRRFAGAEQVGN